MNNTDNIFAQAFDQAIKRAVEIAVEPLHLQIDGLIGEINQLKAQQATPQPTQQPAQQPIAEIDIDAFVDAIDMKEWFWAKIEKYVDGVLENIDFESEVGDALNGMDLNDYIDTDDIASTVADQLDIDDKIREAINGLEVTINLR